jgi:hypothetical protein
MFCFQMSPVNESTVGSMVNGTEENEGGDNKEGGGGGSNGPRKFTFPSHQFHMVTLAKMCHENKEYTDCVIRVGEEDLRAHRLVLAAVSPFLKLVFGEVPSSLSEATILVPGVKQTVVKALLDFLYTGQMTVERQDTSDLQLLIDTLQIDPGLITVEAVKTKPSTSNDTGSKNESSNIESPGPGTSKQPNTSVTDGSKPTLEDEGCKRKAEEEQSGQSLTKKTKTALVEDPPCRD